jgi:hypothetical protein
MKAIETEYKGYRFRSRLEARWAVFFDALEAEWTYEPEGYDLGAEGWYLPDFFLRMSPEWHRRQVYPTAGYWFEVKPIEPTGSELRRLRTLALNTNHHAYLAAGIPGENNLYVASRIESVQLKYDSESRVIPGTSVMESLWFDACLWAPEGLDLDVSKLVDACKASRAARFGR